VAHLTHALHHHFLALMLLHHNHYHSFQHLSGILTRQVICLCHRMTRVLRLDLHPVSNALHSACRHAGHGCCKHLAVANIFHVDLPIRRKKSEVFTPLFVSKNSIERR
jgi:hypothetical protein